MDNVLTDADVFMSEISEHGEHTTNPDLSILIVNYNGRRFLKECLESINEKVGVNHEVIMVDNASIDGSVEFVRKEYPTVRVIESSENLGFSAGNNVAAAAARSELLLLLNNDTRLLSSVRPAVEQFYKNRGIGCIGCKMYYASGDVQPSFGYEHTPLRLVVSWLSTKTTHRWPKIFQRQALPGPLYDTRHEKVAWVSGAFLMTPRRLWQQLRGMDESFFMYVEDVDYCRRMRDAGYQVAFFPEVQILHYEGSGRPWIGTPALRRTVRSYLIYTRKHYGPIAAWFVRLGTSAALLLRVLIYSLQSYAARPESAIIREKREGYLMAVKELLGAVNHE